MNNLPTLSILLPCHNEEKTVEGQLIAILYQLGKDDELVMVDDGSQDKTADIMGKYAQMFPQAKLFRCTRPHGVNGAFNFAHSKATKEWFLGASGNDIVQPGAVDAWRKAAVEFPQAKVIMGREGRGGHPDNKPVFYTVDDLKTKWKQWGGHRVDGCSTFLHRDAWGRGYSAGQWLADWWQIWQAVCRFGICHIPDVISRMGPAGYSALHNNDARYNTALAQIREEVASPCCDDIRGVINYYQKFTGYLDFRPEMIWFEKGK